jgi:3-isopropylmalate/(R)-2-methylmalate dehydratase large subunit
MQPPRSLYEKIVDAHTVRTLEGDGQVLLYVDTSPQAFTGLREAGRSVWSPRASLMTVDHVNPTAPARTPAMADPGATGQVEYFARNAKDFGIELVDVMDPRQGIEHVVMVEQGYVLPGMVVAAGDSHTVMYGALGALGYGIGTSDIEHYLATQTLPYRRLRALRVRTLGLPGPWGTAKDLVIALIARIGAGGATGYEVEFEGDAISALSVEGRLTLCNMIVEAGARGALIAPDRKVLDYLAGRPRAPRGELWEKACRAWLELKADPGARYDREVELDVAGLEPMVTWGTSPDQAAAIGGCVPDPAAQADPARRRGMERALAYMGLEPGTPLAGIPISHAFIGSCTNSRIEDLRAAAAVLRGRRVAPGVRAMIVPGSTPVRAQAEAEGLARIFQEAGFEWRQSGCSMCLAMNDDVLEAGDRCASSTNRNFEGRQGTGARTHLMSPAMVAAAAVAGRLADVRAFPQEA